MSEEQHRPSSRSVDVADAESRGPPAVSNEDKASDLVSASPDIELREYKQSRPISLSPAARQTITTEVNRDTTRLEIDHLPSGQVQLAATRHVGIVALPDGPTIQVRPKVPDTNLLALLRYAQGISPETIDEETEITGGQTFLEALAALFETELRTVLQRGIHTDYRRTRGTESHVRGRIDVQAQLRQGPGLPTTFECEYDELTADTVVNRAVLYATTVLQRFVRDETLAGRLQRHGRQLRRQVTLTPVRPAALESVELDRLSSHYTDLMRLVELVLRNVFIERLQSGAASSFAILVDMADVFESVVERAVSEVLNQRSGFEVIAQPQQQIFDPEGARSVSIRPDILVQNTAGTPVLVGDAKWKLDTSRSREPSTSDLYQLITYQLVHKVPGVLFYPDQPRSITGTYHPPDLDDLRLVAVPVGGPTTTLADRIEEHIASVLDSGIEGESDTPV